MDLNASCKDFRPRFGIVNSINTHLRVKIRQITTQTSLTLNKYLLIKFESKIYMMFSFKLKRKNLDIISIFPLNKK